jgi:GT2 family glycosyltransferase
LTPEGQGLNVTEPSVSIIIVAHNSENDVVDCVNSVLSQDYKNFEIVLVDNASTDQTAAISEKRFGFHPQVRVIRSQKNLGYAGGNNLGFHHSEGELIVVLNPDLLVDKRWLVELLKVYDNHSDSGIVCSNVLLYDDKGVINACGNEIHLTGLVFSRYYMKDKCKCREEIVAAPSGASMIFSRQRLYETGRSEPFDTKRFSMEYSDIDLALDFLGHDLRCYSAPSSLVFHKFRFKMNPARLRTLEIGRYQLLGHLRRRTLVLLLPALILTEIIVWSYAFGKRSGLPESKLAVQIWHMANWNKTFRKNNSHLKDLKILSVMETDLNIYQELGGKQLSPSSFSLAQRFANRVFRLVRNVAVRLL